MVKKHLCAVLVFAIAGYLIGCGGGGGGSSTNGGTNATTSTTSTTSGTTSGSTAGLMGRVIDDFNSGVSGVKVDFYSSGGTKLNTATTDANGNFSIFVDPAVTNFFIAPAGVPVGHHRSFYYGSKVYSTLIATCKPSVAGVTAGSSTNLPFPIRIPLSSSPPPPPPDGCN